MKAVKLFISLMLNVFILASCTVNINYPENHIVDYIIESNGTAATTEETTGIPETEAIPDTEATPKTEAVTNEPTTEAVTEPHEESTESVIAETKAESTAEETTAYVSDIYLYDLTTPISKNKTATVSIIGQPNTEYSIEVFYATGKSTAKGLENKISSDIGAVSWSWKIGPSVKTGYYKIVITGGGKSLETEIQVY